MIVKHRDASSELIKAIEKQATRTSDKVKRSACASAASRLRADPTTGYACDLIDSQFSQSDDWAVIHDLRLRVNGHAIQINHLLISSALNFVCVDSRLINNGLDINPQGKCHAFDRRDRWPIASPMAKAARDMRKLKEHIQETALLPWPYSFARKAIVRSYVLTNPALRLCVEAPGEIDSIGVHSSNALFPLLWNTSFNKAPLLGKLLSADHLFDIASSLAEQHSPAYSSALLDDDSLATESTRALMSRAA